MEDKAKVIPPRGRHQIGGSTRSKRGGGIVTRKSQGSARAKFQARNMKEAIFNARVEGDLHGLSGDKLIAYIESNTDYTKSEIKSVLNAIV